jgi:hypothetical protein
MHASTMFVVACSGTKSPEFIANGRALACNAYAGQLFRMARRQVSEARAAWCILSGKYGFVSPLAGIDYYEQRMQPVRGIDDMPHAFELLHGDPTGAGIRCASRIIVLGSALYAEAAAALLRRHVEAPLAGLPIGRMLQRMAAGLVAAELARDIPHRQPELELAA